MVKLKVKFLKFYTGRPVAILNNKFAEKATIHVGDRIKITKGKKEIIAIIDTSPGMLKENEIIVSEEIGKALELRENNAVDINIAEKPASLQLIQKKLLCKKLNEQEIQNIVSDIVKNALTEAEIAYFVSAIYQCGMSMKEIASLTKAIVKTGKKLKIRGLVADKHSVGGMPGRTTPIIVSICSSAGLIIPKTSSRAITSAAGTADALEVICRVTFSLNEIKKIIKKTKACMVWGGSLNLAPADDRIIQVEKLLNLDPEAQLLASILAKKISVDSKYILIDIPYGKNAKVSESESIKLARHFEQLGRHFGLKIRCSRKQADEPLGNGIGPALEIKDVISVLKRKDSCYLLESRALELSGELLELTGKAKKGRGYSLARKILDSGEAFKKFSQIIKAQDGSIKQIKEAEFKHHIKAASSFIVKDISVKELNQIARIAGCPLDKYAGVYLHKHLHSHVKKNELLLTIYAESPDKLKEAVAFYKKTRPIK